MITFLYILSYKVVQILNLCILASILYDWFAPNADNIVTRVLHGIARPILNPISRAIYPLTMKIGIDLSPILAYYLIRAVHSLFLGVLNLFYF